MRWERKALVRRRQSVEAPLKTVTRGQVRRITYSSGGPDELGMYRPRAAMRGANDAVKRLNGFIWEGR